MDKLVQRYGLRDDAYVDVTFERIKRLRRGIMRARQTQASIEIFPRVRSYELIAQAFGLPEFKGSR